MLPQDEIQFINKKCIVHLVRQLYKIPGQVNARLPFIWNVPGSYGKPFFGDASMQVKTNSARVVRVFRLVWRRALPGCGSTCSSHLPERRCWKCRRSVLSVLMYPSLLMVSAVSSQSTRTMSWTSQKTVARFVFFSAEMIHVFR